MAKRFFWLVVFSFAAVLFLINACEDDLYSRRENYVEKYRKEVRENMYKGRIVGIALQVEDSVIYSDKRDVVGDAIGGAAVGYLFFGPIGGIAGAGGAIQSSMEDMIKNGKFLQHRKIKEFIIITEDEKGDTSYFSVIVPPEIDLNMFAKKSIPSYLQILLQARIGKKIRIPSRTPLSREARVYSSFIYFGDEKIPYIDYFPLEN